MINWREVPFVRLLLPFILGIYLQITWGWSMFPLVYFMLSIVPLLGYLVFLKIKFKRQWISGILVNLFFLLFGICLSYTQDERNNTNHFKPLVQSQNTLLGVVNTVPELSAKTLSFQLKINELGAKGDSLIPCHGTILIRLPIDSLSSRIQYGDLLLVSGKVKGIPKKLNPGGFDMQRYLGFRNVYYQCWLKKPSWSILERDKGNVMLAWAYKSRAKLINVLKSRIQRKREFAVAAALILGYKEGLNNEIKSAYANTGATHVLAVSGLHAGLIWAIIAFLLKWVPLKSRLWSWTKTTLTIFGLWMFALISGASPSVLRAATMFSFLILGNSLNRNTNIYNTLAVSAFVLLMFNPWLIFEIGFQLSYLAVIGIVYFYQKIYGLWYIANPVGDYLWRLAVVSIAAQLVTFPISVFYFQQFPVYFLLSGLVVVPAAFLVLSLGLLLFFIEKLIPFLAVYVAKLLFVVLWLMNALIFLIDQLPSTFSKNIWMSWETMILWYLIIISFVIAFKLKQKKAIFFGTMLFLILVGKWSVKKINTYNQKQIIVYNIPGKTYVECIDGDHTYAFGSRDINLQRLDYIRKPTHVKKEVKSIEQIYFGQSDICKENWCLSQQVFQFYDTRFAFIDRLPLKDEYQRFHVDYIVLRKMADVDVKDLDDFFIYSTLILDGSIGWKKRSQIKFKALELGKHVIDTTVDGAFQLDLNNKK